MTDSSVLSVLSLVVMGKILITLWCKSWSNHAWWFDSTTAVCAKKRDSLNLEYLIQL